jgi:hypothetical protein
MVPRSAHRRFRGALAALFNTEAEMTSRRNEIEAARRHILMVRACVRRLKPWRGFEPRRREMVLAATLALDTKDSKGFARAFRDIADQAGIPEPRAGSSAHRRLLTYLELQVTASSMSRACRQIEACLKAGWGKDEITRRMMAGPSKIA